MSNKRHGTLYIGVTRNLVVRVWQHKNKATAGFTAKYNLTRLVYFELFEDIYEAISREKRLKAGSRRTKIRLIEKNNPEWRDLYEEISA
jgi:putative endonuclease